MEQKYINYLEDRMRSFSLEELFEHLGLDPMDVIHQMHLEGLINLDDIIEDEVFEFDHPDEYE